MTIAAGKKRFYLTLTETNYVQYRQMLKDLGAPAGTDAAILDEFMKGMYTHVAPLIEKARSTGKDITFIDFLAMFGNMMKEAQDDQGNLL